VAIRGLVRWAVVSFGMLLFCALGAQGQKDVPRLTLQLEREIPVPGQGAAATVHPIKCDARGNIYVRFHGVRYFSAPVVKISPDGERKAVFATEKVPGWDGADIYDFDVGTDGQVYLLAARPTKDRKIELGLISLNDEGGHRFTAAVKLRLRSAGHLAVFSTGEFLLTGFREVERSPADDAEAAATGVKQEQKVEPVTAILDRSGNVIQELQLPSDSSFGEAPGTERRPLLGPEAISMGAIAMGQDGNLYMMFHTEKPKLYVISADGVLVRTLEISPPSEKAGALTLGSRTESDSSWNLQKKAKVDSTHPRRWFFRS